VLLGGGGDAKGASIEGEVYLLGPTRRPDSGTDEILEFPLSLAKSLLAAPALLRLSPLRLDPVSRQTQEWRGEA
jgi:hypothetical protein